MTMGTFRLFQNPPANKTGSPGGAATGLSFRLLVRSLVCLATLAGPPSVVHAHDGTHEAPVGESVENTKNWPGQTVDAIGTRVIDVHGRIHRLGVTKDARPFVVVFIDEHCPISRRYGPELNAFHGLSKNAGVPFYAVISDPIMSAARAREYVQSAAFTFPVLWDSSGDLAARFQPQTTPEVFVVAPDNSVLYRGRIDNRFASIGVLRNKITSHDLSNIIADLGAGKDVPPRRTSAVGCFFESWDAHGLPDEITYTRDIAPIVNANCVECHRAGGIAPFPLETHAEVKRRARMVAHVTAEGIMPPWRAAAGFGHFRDERHLSKRQIELLDTWAKTGAPLGDSEQALPPPKWPSRDWHLGPPDLVIEMEQAFEVPASGQDIYRYFVIPFELTGDRDIIAAEFRPGDPSVVHHTLVYADYTGGARLEDAKDGAYGFSYFGTGGFMSSLGGDVHYIFGWSPGIDPLNLPPDVGMPIPGKSGDAVFEIHYRPNGRATRDRSRIGLYFADEPVARHASSFVAGTVDVDIAPGDDNYWRQVYTEVPADIELIAVSPHMHYLGREVKAIATLPDGREIPLVHIPNWDFRWQNLYLYREPLKLPAGSRIDAWFKFDNSASNPYNPRVPPARITWGWSSDQEMCELWMRFVPADEAGRAAVKRAGRQSWGRTATVREPPPG